MDRKTLGSYAAIPLVLVLVVSIFMGIQPDPTHSCEAEESVRYCFDISGGKHTRCYLTPEKNSWDYCSSGWEPLAEWVDEYIEQPLEPSGEYLCYTLPRGCENK